MPATLTALQPVNVSVCRTLPEPVRPAPVRLVNARSCPACGEARCADPAECLRFLTVRPWGDCDWCAGTGWAGDESPAIFCEGCGGSGLEEYGPGTSPCLSANVAARLAAHIDRLRAMAGVTA